MSAGGVTERQLRLRVREVSARSRRGSDGDSDGDGEVLGITARVALSDHSGGTVTRSDRDTTDRRDSEGDTDGDTDRGDSQGDTDRGDSQGDTCDHLVQTVLRAEVRPSRHVATVWLPPCHVRVPRGTLRTLRRAWQALQPAPSESAATPSESAATPSESVRSVRSVPHMDARLKCHEQFVEDLLQSRLEDGAAAGTGETDGAGNGVTDDDHGARETVSDDSDTVCDGTVVTGETAPWRFALEAAPCSVTVDDSFSAHVSDWRFRSGETVVLPEV
ncbi:MAG: hypothetical protein MHM6MM_009649, partial [Cercozoa sp. M6MM]